MSLKEVIALLQDANKKYDALYQEQEDLKSDTAAFIKTIWSFKTDFYVRIVKHAVKKRKKAVAPNFVLVVVSQ